MKNRFIYSVLAGVAVWIGSVNLIFAQTGKIAGRITDKKTGETLIGLSVKVKGSSFGASTNTEGRYLLVLNPGKYTLDFSYLGYQTKSVTDVVVKPGAVTNLDLVMEEASGRQLTEVVISASVRRESLAGLYARQRHTANISDGISSDVIRRSPDRNTGDVLKRVSGASIQDDKFVVIRGLSDRYNESMMNNSVLPSTEPDKKAFSFNIIPSNLVDDIVIYKTGSPDLPGDFSGGAVKVNTKDLADNKFAELSLSMGYNSKTTFQNNFLRSEYNGSLDFLGFTNGSRSLPSAYTRVKSGYSSTSSSQKIAIAKQFPNTFAYSSNNTGLPSLSLQLSLGNSKLTQADNRFGYVFSLNYGTSYRVINGVRNDYNAVKLLNESYSRNTYSDSKNLGSILNFAYTFGRNKLALRNFFNNDFRADIIDRVNGINTEGSSSDPLYFSGYSNKITQNGLYNSVLEGQHSLGRKNVLLDWNASYGISYSNEPDQRIITVFNRNDSPAPYLDFSSENSPKANDLGRIYSNLNENIYGASANLTVPFKLFSQPQKLKTGLAANYRDRDFTTDALGYVDIIGNGKKIFLNNNSIDHIFSPAGIEQNNLALARLDLNSTNYSGTAGLNAAYVMLDNKLSSKLRLVWGGRVENYQQTLAAPNKGTKNYENTDFLPSANLTYSLSESTNLKASYFQALNRPEFRELADYRHYDYESDFIIAGNPNLVRSTSRNVDLRYEFYPSGGEIISASVFYKNFKNPIEQTNEGNSILSYENSPEATDWGLELELRKKLDFISDKQFWKNLSFYANLSYIKGNVTLADRKISAPLQGQSPYIINSGLTYIGKSFSFNILYNRTGERLKYRGEMNSQDIYERSRDVLDFQISKKLFHQAAEIKLSVSDLLAQPYGYYYYYGSNGKTAYNPSRDRLFQSWNEGVNTSLSFKYNLSYRRSASR